MNIKRDAIVTNDEYEPFLDFDEKGHVCSKQEKDQRGSDHEEPLQGTTPPKKILNDVFLQVAMKRIKTFFPKRKKWIPLGLIHMKHKSSYCCNQNDGECAAVWCSIGRFITLQG